MVVEPIFACARPGNRRPSCSPKTRHDGSRPISPSCRS